MDWLHSCSAAGPYYRSFRCRRLAAEAQYAELKETTKGFKETFEKIWDHLSTKVSDATCQESFQNTRCNIASLEADFRKHSHTNIPENSKLIIRSSQVSVNDRQLMTNWITERNRIFKFAFMQVPPEIQYVMVEALDNRQMTFEKVADAIRKTGFSITGE